MKKIVLILLFVLSVNICCAGELSKQATAFYSDNNFNKTLELLLQINERERSAQDWLLLGNLMHEKGEKDNAIFMYQKATFADPKFYKAYYNLGGIYMEDGKYLAAVDSYKQAVKYNPNSAYAYYNLGCAYLKMAKTKDAKNAFLKAVTIKNDIPELQYNLAYVYKVLNKPKLAQIYLDNYNKLTENVYSNTLQ